MKPSSGVQDFFFSPRHRPWPEVTREEPDDRMDRGSSKLPKDAVKIRSLNEKTRIASGTVSRSEQREMRAQWAGEERG